eukprot:9109013-Alexandrium_andersonii.AAC.1
MPSTIPTASFCTSRGGGRRTSGNHKDVYKDDSVSPFCELIIGWPLPFFVVDQFGSITDDAKLRKRQGI